MKNWEKIKLGDLSEVITKGTTPTSIGYNFTDSGIKFIKVESLTESGEIIPNKVAYIDEDCHQVLKRSQLKKDDILFSIAGALGRIGIVKEDILPANTNQALAIIRLKKDSNALVDFIAKYFNSNIVTDEIEKLRIGAAQQNLSLTQLNNLFVPLPPLPEQQRIVSILDEAFSVIERSRNNAEQNLKNAKELFESYLQGVFDPSTRSGQGKGDGWEERRFDEVCVLQRGFDLPTHSRFEGEYPLVSSNGITDRINQWKVKAPGVVTGRSGTIGNVHFIVEDFWPLNTALYIKDFHGNDERFIYYFLTAFDLSKYSSGAGVPTLNRNNVHSVKVRIPKSKTQQQAIVRQLDALRAETQNLEAVYQKKLYDLEELKKSVLRKAFAGEL